MTDMAELACENCGRFLEDQLSDRTSSPQSVICPACGHEQWVDLASAEAELAPQPPRTRWLQRDLEPHRGTLILALGILSLALVAVLPCLGIPLGIAAWVMGRADLKKIRQGLMDPTGESSTNAGRICGQIGTIVSLVLTLLIAVFYVGIFAIAFFVAVQQQGQAPAANGDEERPAVVAPEEPPADPPMPDKPPEPDAPPADPPGLQFPP
jgi:hypothetical protein